MVVTWHMFFKDVPDLALVWIVLKIQWREITFVLSLDLMYLAGATAIAVVENSPHVDLTWEAVGALTAVSSVLGCLFLLILRMVIDSSVEKSFAKLKERMEELFVTEKLCATRHLDMDRRVNILEEEIRPPRSRQGG